MNWRVEVAQNAARRRAAEVRREMSRGVFGLATVAATAPFVGIFGNLLGIVNSFVGCGGEKSTCMAALVERLSWALAPTGYGVAVAVVALAGYQYLSARAAEMADEMEAAVVELPSWLAARAHPRG